MEISREAWCSADDMTKEYMAVSIEFRSKDFACLADIHFDDDNDLILLADVINDYIAKHIKTK